MSASQNRTRKIYHEKHAEREDGRGPHQMLPSRLARAGARWDHDSMHPDSGCYEARFRVSRAAQRGWSTSLILLPTAIGLLRVNLPVALVLLVFGAITLLPIAAGLAVRRTALRAD